MSTTTGADTALDLDAIEARADAASEGRWYVYTGTTHDPAYGLTCGIGSTEAPAEEAILEDPFLSAADAEFIAQARTDVPALVAEVRRLRNGASVLGRLVDRQLTDILDITGLHHMVDETGDGDWGAIWDLMGEMVARGRERTDFRPPARVIVGDVGSVTAALDGLPVGSIIAIEDDGLTKGGAVYHKRQFPQSEPQWYESGFATRVYARGIARHQVPITVLREGTGA